MNAELIAVGSELLRAGSRDTNGDWLTERLERVGIDVRARHVVADDVAQIARIVDGARQAAEIVLICGGLGPTADDLTREGLSAAVGSPLETDPPMVARLKRGFEARGLAFTEAQTRQARRPEGFDWLDNEYGSAPGLCRERDGRLLAALPGVPAEMRAMFEQGILPRLRGRGGARIVQRTLRVAGRGESAIDRRIRDLYHGAGTELTILAGAGEIRLQLRARGRDAEEARRRLDTLEEELTSRLGNDVYGRDDDTLAGVVGERLLRAGRTLASAESCTAGLLSAAITEIPGASGWFRGGLVVYDDRLKVRLAGVREATLRQSGAVSEPVALELAAGARVRCAADLGVGITGIAGPGGGSAEKPVGRVHIAVVDAERAEAWRLDLPGDRDLIRRRAVALALDRVRRRLLPA